MRINYYGDTNYMPYKIVKDDGGYFVQDEKGKKFSKHPLAKVMAQRQREAIAISESRKKGKNASYYFIK